MPRPISQSAARFLARSHLVIATPVSVLANDARGDSDLPEFADQRCCHAKISTPLSTRKLSASRDVAAHEAFQSMAGEEERSHHDGDAERVRRLVDTGHGALPVHRRAPVTEMDRALGALASHRDPAGRNADTYVIALCVLAFVSIALLGFYPFYAARNDDAAAVIPPALSCGSEAGRPAADRDAKTGTTCR